MADELKKGDPVQWKSSGGTAIGTVVRKLTEPIDIHDFHVAASKDDPRYLVESEASGKEAAHKPDALTKVKG